MNKELLILCGLACVGIGAGAFAATLMLEVREYAMLFTVAGVLMVIVGGQCDEG